MTATLDIPRPTLRPGWHPAAWVGTTPAWLRTVTAALCALALAAGIAGALTVQSRSHSLSTGRTVAEPLVVDAQTMVVELSDANTTVAGGFLAGPVFPTAAQNRASADLAQAAAAVTAASQRAGTSPQVTKLLQTLLINMPLYSGIVATAEADYRQGQPVAAAYLAEANGLMSSTLLPAASSLYSLEQARLSEENRQATDRSGQLVVLALLAALLIALVYVQVRLARRFHRLLNPGLLLATVAVVAMVIWVSVALAAEGGAVARSARVGSTPLGVLTHARILDGQARADDELTLVTRDSDPSYQKDYGSVSARLGALLSNPGKGWTADEIGDLGSGNQQWAAYSMAHNTVRQADAMGDLSGAVATDATVASSDSQQLDVALSQGINSAVTSFSSSARAAAADLDGLVWAGLLLVLVVAGSVIAGVEPRLKEYR
jgi:hypothetical protein